MGGRENTHQSSNPKKKRKRHMIQPYNVYITELMDIKAAVDGSYDKILLAVKREANFKQLPGHHPSRKLLNICCQLSIAMLGKCDVIMLDDKRDVVSMGAQPGIIRELQRAHSSITKTCKTRRELYFWPNMKEEICKAIYGCQFCQEDRPAQARPKLTGLLPSALIPPMLHIATNLFDTHIILVDRFSGYAWKEKLQHTDARSICQCLI